MPTRSPPLRAGGFSRVVGDVESFKASSYTKKRPSQINCAGPRRNTSCSKRTVCAPPGACTATGVWVRPVVIAATAAAHEPVPEDCVSPTPRSKKRDIYIALIFNMYQLNVNAMLEDRITLHFGRPPQPIRPELRHKHHEVRIPHRDRNPLHLAKRRRDGSLFLHHRHSHRSFELRDIPAARNKRARLYPCAGANPHRSPSGTRRTSKPPHTGCRCRRSLRRSHPRSPVAPRHPHPCRGTATPRHPPPHRCGDRKCAV